MVKLESVYGKSLQHLTRHAVLLNKFLSTSEGSRNRLDWLYHRKMILTRSYSLGKKSNSNWSFKLYKNVVRNWQLHIYGKKEKKILLSDIKWLNDQIMDNLKSYQSVLKWQKKVIPFFKVNEEHIQLKYNGANHWLMSFSSSNRV